MEATRIESARFKADLEKALSLLIAAWEILRPYLVILTEAQRKALLRPPTEFPEAGMSLARAAKEIPEIGIAVGTEPEAVIEDLENAEALRPLAEKVAEMAQQLSDTRLTWLHEAFVPSLAMYGVAKVLARTDGRLRTVIDPLARIFPGRPRTATKPVKEGEIKEA